MNYLTRRLLTEGARAVGHAAADLVVRGLTTVLKATVIATLFVLVFLAGAGLMAAVFAFQPHQVDCTYIPAGGPFGP